MRLSFLIILFSLLICSFTYAQYTNVMISNQNSPEEVSICINPKNTNIILAGSNTLPSTSSGAYYYSTNGGLNWSGALLTCPLYGVWGDPVIMVDTMGYFYFFHLANNPNLPWPAIDRMVCQKSTNNGVNWSAGTYAGLNPPKLQDKEGAVIDRSNNYIYLTWTQFDSYVSNPPATDSSRILLSKSTDGGETWSATVRIDKLGGDCRDGDNTVEGAVPAVGPNGEVYVAWSGPIVRNSQYGILFNKSTDKGQTWLLNPVHVANQPGGWACSIAGIGRANGMPAIVCDLSNGPYRGNIYINYLDSVSGVDHDVRLIKSTNGGLNWSSVKRVNNDGAGKEQFFTWMAIDQTTGYLYFVFYDRRNYSNNNTDVYMARSTDGGDTFTNFVVSSSPFLPSPGTFFGDYNGISAHAGKIRPIWTKLAGSSLSIWTAMVNEPLTGVENNFTNIPSKYELSQNYPNPFNPVTSIKYQLPEAGYTILKVYDVLGNEISTLVDGKKKAGNYEVHFEGQNISSGVYYYKLTSGNYSDTKKMILVK
jgi:hypothetical protein